MRVRTHNRLCEACGRKVVRRTFSGNGTTRMTVVYCRACGHTQYTRGSVIVPHLWRRPPSPIWMLANTPAGVCGWCGDKIEKGQRLRPKACRWHLECLHEYMVMTNADYAKHTLITAGQTCTFCGEQHGPFDLDHITALALWSPRRHDEITQDNLIDWYAPWAQENLQLLCPSCHKDKTADDIKEIRKCRRC